MCTELSIAQTFFQLMLFGLMAYGISFITNFLYRI